MEQLLFNLVTLTWLAAIIMVILTNHRGANELQEILADDPGQLAEKLEYMQGIKRKAIRQFCTMYAVYFFLAMV